jgi:hypothetical protein
MNAIDRLIIIATAILVLMIVGACYIIVAVAMGWPVWGV